jgi:hypothetical protein
MSGVDLARVALRAAQEAAKNNGSGRTAKPKRRTRVVRGDGRDPMGLGDTIGALITERARIRAAVARVVGRRPRQPVPEW